MAAWRAGTAVILLGAKEFVALWRDPVMLVLVLHGFTVSIRMHAEGMPETLQGAPIAIVDEDRSALSDRVVDAFQPPRFRRTCIEAGRVDEVLDAGESTFVLVIPPNFQRDLLARRSPAVQLSIDATRTSQAWAGGAYAQAIVLEEVARFTGGDPPATPARLALRMRFNPPLEETWFGAVMELINTVTMTSIVLVGAAMLREREHGTVEHLLAMPLRPVQLMLAKVWPLVVVVLVATAMSLVFVVEAWIGAPVEGSRGLFLVLALAHLCATTSMGILLATLSRSMPQFALLTILVILPLEMLSGGMTPRESMPEWLRTLMLAAPTTHFVAGSQAVLHRAAGLDIVWPHLAALAGTALAFFGLALARFRASLARRG